MKVFSVLLIVSLIVILITLVSKYFVINHIECFTQFDKCDDALSAQISQGLPIKYTKINPYVKEVFDNNSEVYKYSMQLKLPSTVRLDLVIRKPVFALRSESVNSVSLIDQYGKVVSIEEFTNLPSMYIEGRLPNVGEEVSRTILSQVRVSQGLYKTTQIEKISIKGSDMYISATNTPQMILPTSEDNELLVGSVGLVLSRLKHILEETKIDMSNVSRIDFRYKDPIIVKV